MKTPRPAEIEELKKKYVGTRIMVIEMPLDPHPVPQGTEGTCIMVDGAGQLVVKWDNGSTLSLLPYVDTFEVIAPAKHECRLSDLVTNPRPKSRERGCI